jgi:predicted GTPase
LLAYKNTADKRKRSFRQLTTEMTDYPKMKKLMPVPRGWREWHRGLIRAQKAEERRWHREATPEAKRMNPFGPGCDVNHQYARARKRSWKNWGILRERIRSLKAQVRKDIMMKVYEEEQMKEQMREQMKEQTEKRKKMEHRHFKRNIAAGVFFSNWVLILSLLW